MNVTRRYGNRRTLVFALDGVSVGVRAGTFVAVMGATGSGKSTLLHCAAGLDRVLAAELQELAKAAQPKGAGTRDLVDQLPHVDLNVLDLPGEKQRQLFDAFQLEIRYDRHLQRITLRVAVRAEMVDAISQAATEATGKKTPGVPMQRQLNAKLKGQTR